MNKLLEQVLAIPDLSSLCYHPSRQAYTRFGNKSYMDFTALRKKVDMASSDLLGQISRDPELFEEWKRILSPATEAFQEISPSVSAMLVDLKRDIQLLKVAEEGCPTLFYRKSTKRLTPQYHEDLLNEYANLTGQIQNSAQLVVGRVLEPYVDLEDQLMETPEGTKINLYTPPAWRVESAEPPDRIPPTVEWFLTHLFGGDESSIRFVLGWLQYLLKFGKNDSALTMVGAKGLGKNVFFDKIIRPLVGVDYCSTADNNMLNSQFNGELDNKIAVLYDEFNLTVEETSAFKRYFNDNIMIETKGRNPVEKKSWVNFVIFANEKSAVRIESDDRRFSVPVLGTTPLRLALGTRDVGEFLASLDNEVFGFGRWLLAQKLNYRRSDFLVTSRYDELVSASKEDWQVVLDEILEMMEIGETLKYKEFLLKLGEQAVNRRNLSPRTLKDYLLNVDGVSIERIHGLMEVKKTSNFGGSKQ